MSGMEPGAVEHGGDLHAAKARFPEAPEPWIDLSTGINPVAYPFTPPPLAAFARLPSPAEIRALERVAAKAYGVGNAEALVAAAGSQPLIGALPRLRARAKVAVLGPTYREHQRAWEAAGAEVAVVPGLEEALRRGPDVIVAVNPNNPDGRVLSRADLMDAAAAIGARGGWLVVDEAFADFQPGESVAQDPRPGLIVLRSLGKAYGLAGLRVGFAVTEPGFAARLRTHLGPWAVSGPAIAIAAEALADEAWLAAEAPRLAASAARLDELLVNAGFTVLGGTVLFRGVRHPEARQWFERLARKGVWVRQFSDNPDFLRFGNPPPGAWERLQDALRNR